MQIATTVAQARALFDALPRPLGFVPTMGALHEGHLTLIAAAKDESASVAASVFVNPLQFGPGEDLDRYPRDLEGDRRAMAEAGVDVLFAPAVEAVYPPGFTTSIDVGPMGVAFEGVARPSHFRGVTTVVGKLLHVARPTALYLGQKDAQQTAVLATMVRDLDFPTAVRIVPTRRAPDGLALSSRNQYLSPDDRRAAATLVQALQAARAAFERGDQKEAALAAGRAALAPSARWEYLDVVDQGSFQPLDWPRPPCFIVGAARFGATRLIDNLWLPA